MANVGAEKWFGTMAVEPTVVSYTGMSGGGLGGTTENQDGRTINSTLTYDVTNSTLSFPYRTGTTYVTSTRTTRYTSDFTHGEIKGLTAKEIYTWQVTEIKPDTEKITFTYNQTYKVLDSRGNCVISTDPATTGTSFNLVAKGMSFTNKTWVGGNAIGIEASTSATTTHVYLPRQRRQ